MELHCFCSRITNALCRIRRRKSPILICLDRAHALLPARCSAAGAEAYQRRPIRRQLSLFAQSPKALRRPQGGVQLESGRLRGMRDNVSEAEWAMRVDLAACYRVVAHYGWDDLVFTHISARVPDLGTHKFGMLIVRFTEVLVLFVLLINLLFHRPWLESFLFAVALAVGLTPELLPMIVSVTLARGAIRMATAQVIVKRLGAIHDLGSMDVLCTDKTGTLTEAKIKLARQVTLSGAGSE